MITFIASIIGMIFGSFIAASAFRFGARDHETSLKKIFTQPSHCEKCMKQLQIFDLIPIISFIWLKGKCRYCSTKINPSYLLVEVICSIVFALFASNFLISGKSINLAIILINLYTLLMFIYWAYYDFLYWEIPIFTVSLTGGLLLLFRLGQFIAGNITTGDFVNYLAAGLIGFVFIAFLIFVSHGKGLGWGDAIVFVNVGLALSIIGLVETFYISIISGAIIGIIKVVLSTKKLKGAQIQFVPFITFGVIVAMLWPGYLFSSLFPWI